MLFARLILQNNEKRFFGVERPYRVDPTIDNFHSIFEWA